MYVLNKIVGSIVSPVGMGVALLLASGLARVFQRRRLSSSLAFMAVGWLWIWSTPAVFLSFGKSLEGKWPVASAEEAPTADAIVVLGGGMGANTNATPYAEMWFGADRVWHAARLYKAGRAPLVVPTGSGERESSLPLLLDLGVPQGAIRIEDAARNTEENARNIAKMLAAASGGRRPKILLVTSAWHMRRALLMFSRYAPELDVVPAAADYEATVRKRRGLRPSDFLPSAEALYYNTYFFKEWLGYWGYRLRK